MKKLVVKIGLGVLVSGVLSTGLVAPAQAALFKHHPHFNHHPHLKHHPHLNSHPHFKHHPRGVL